MKHAVVLLLLCILNTSFISGSNPNVCEGSEKSRKFIRNCYNIPKTQFTIEVQEDGCKSYFACKDRKFSLHDCGKKDGKQQYFQNGTCTTKPPSSCKLGCFDGLYEYFLLDCVSEDQFILNDFDNCQSGYLCKNSTLISVNCDNTTGEDVATKGCKFRETCVASRRGSDPNDCDGSEKWRAFVRNCYNNPKTEYKVELQQDFCRSYFVCKDKKFSLQDCEKKDGKQQYFQNGKCTTQQPPCKPACFDMLYEIFLVHCTWKDHYIQNDFDYCQSVFLCKNSTLSSVKCSSTRGEEWAKWGCDIEGGCFPSIGFI